MPAFRLPRPVYRLLRLVRSYHGPLIKVFDHAPRLCISPAIAAESWGIYGAEDPDVNFDGICSAVTSQFGILEPKMGTSPRGRTALEVSTLFTVLAFIVVVLRLYTRMFLVRVFNVEEYLIALAMVWYTLQCYTSNGSPLSSYVPSA